MPHRFVNPYAQFWDIVGTSMLPNGTIQFFENTTTTPAEVFSDADLTTSIGSTITLDAGGRAREVYFDGTLTIEVFDANGAFLRRVDNVTSIGSESSSGTTVVLFDSVDAAILSTTLIVNTVIETASYFDAWTTTTDVPRGGAFYEVVAVDTFTPDGLVNHACTGTTTLLKFIPNHDDSINVFQAGAISDGSSDDQPQIQSALDLIGKVEIPITADCGVNGQIILKDNNEFIINGTITRTFTRLAIQGIYKESATLVNENAPPSFVDDFDSNDAWLNDTTTLVPSVVDDNIKISGEGTIQTSSTVSALIVSDSSLVAGPAICLLAVSNVVVSGSIKAGGGINTVAYAFWLFNSYITGLRCDLSTLLETEHGIQVIGGNDITVGPCVLTTGGDAFIIGSIGNIAGNSWTFQDSVITAFSGFAVTFQQNREGVTTGFAAANTIIRNVSMNNISGASGIRTNGICQIKADTTNLDSVREIVVTNLVVTMGLLASHDGINGQIVIANGGQDISINGTCSQTIGKLFDCTKTDRMSLNFSVAGAPQITSLTDYGVFFDNEAMIIDGSYNCGTAPSEFLFVIQDGSYTFLGRYFNLEDGYEPFSIDPQVAPAKFKLNAQLNKKSAPTVVAIDSVSLGSFDKTKFNLPDTAPDIWTGDSIFVSGFTGDRVVYNGWQTVEFTKQTTTGKTISIAPAMTSSSAEGSFTVETRIPRNIIVRGDGTDNPGANVIEIGGTESDFNDYLKLIEDDAAVTIALRGGPSIAYDTVIVIPSKGTEVRFHAVSTASSFTVSSYGGTTLYINADETTTELVSEILAPVGLMVPWSLLVRIDTDSNVDFQQQFNSTTFGSMTQDGAATVTMIAKSYGYAKFQWSGFQWESIVFDNNGQT